MYAVLDGEATPDEVRSLERLLDADPAARAQFEELSALFREMSRVPRQFPPEGLVAAVMASVPRRPAPGRRGPRARGRLHRQWPVHRPMPHLLDDVDAD
jgi:anti-sigma factor RsiW